MFYGEKNPIFLVVDASWRESIKFFEIVSFAEIRTLTGEPDYKSVNLTWGVEDLPADDEDILPRSFVVYFCELQSWGPHRCKSKTLEDNEVAPPSELE